METDGTAKNSVVEKDGEILLYGKLEGATVSGYLQSAAGEDHDTVIKSGASFQITGSQKTDDAATSFNAVIENDATVSVARNAQLNAWNVSGKVSVYKDIDDDNKYFPVFNDAKVNKDGIIHLNYGAEMFNTDINGGRVDVGSSDINFFSTVTDTLIDDGDLYVTQNGIANNTTLNSGNIHIQDGGTTNNTEVYGAMDNNGGTDNATTIRSGGSFSLSGSLADKYKAVSNNADIENGATVSINENSEANSWTINGADNDFVFLKTDTSVINDSTVNSGDLQIDKGTATNTIINGGQMVNANGTDTDTVLNGGAYFLGGEDAATSSGLTVNNGATASIRSGTVTDATISGTMFVSPETTSSGTISTLQGNILVNDGGKLKLTSGINSAGANMTLADSGSLYLATRSATDSHAFESGAMTMEGGHVYFGHTDDGYTSLTLDSLKGAGSFYMNTDLASLRGDFLTVREQASGNFDVYIADSGVSPASDSSLQIINTGGGDADFTLANNGHVVDVGTYQYHLVADGHGGWALTPEKNIDPVDPDEPVDPVDPDTPDEPVDPVIPPVDPVEPPDITPSTAAVLSMATVDPLVFQAEMSSIRERLAEVRSFSHDTNVWGHYIAHRLRVNDAAGAGYGLNLNGVTLGGDKSTEYANGVTTKGIFFSYSHSDVSFNRGGKGDVDSYSLGAYTSYLHDSGFWLDGVFKVNRFGNNIDARMTSGTIASGYYNTTGIGTNLQGGKYFYFGDSYVTPYAAITGFTSNTSDYTLSNGMKAHVSPQKSVTGETGVSFGHKFVVHGALVQPYIKLAVTQEFIDDNKVKVNDDHFTNDLSGTRGVYQLGVNTKVTDRLTVHADASYAQGSHVEAPWTANLGASWSF
ncbi:hypothetical protein NG99_24415 [Erwinia typographi]|uniref:Autotransporter domain-containing protein n=1 Tax=Erwinia typographi TaxID=371042 RepID=A0A0A3ZMV7_9GAMM|nr:hypothetical protein NG99_24415 [Erwinia typographi]